MNILIVTNILTPYRKFFFDKLNKEFSENGDIFTVLLMAKTEANRSWKYEDFAASYTRVLPARTFKMKNNIYVHLNSKVKKTLHELSPDIIIAAGSYTLPTIWRVISLKKRFGYQILFWSESHFNEEKNHKALVIKFREWLRKKTYSSFDGFWYAGRLSKEFIDEYAKSNIKIFCPNLIDSEVFDKASTLSQKDKLFLRNSYGVTEDKYIFICPARLSAEKGIDKFIGVLSKNEIFKQKGVFLIAGNGPMEQALKDLIMLMDCQNVKLLGLCNQDAMVELYSIADCFCLPSLSDPNPLTCIEALCSGLPLLVSEHVGNSHETVLEGENGYVFTYKDEKDIHNKLNLLFNASNHWNVNARLISKQIFSHIYDADKQVKRIVNEVSILK